MPRSTKARSSSSASRTTRQSLLRPRSLSAILNRPDLWSHAIDPPKARLRGATVPPGPSKPACVARDLPRYVLLREALAPAETLDRMVRRSRSPPTSTTASAVCRSPRARRTVLRARSLSGQFPARQPRYNGKPTYQGLRALIENPETPAAILPRHFRRTHSCPCRGRVGRGLRLVQARHDPHSLRSLRRAGLLVVSRGTTLMPIPARRSPCRPPSTWRRQRDRARLRLGQGRRSACRARRGRLCRRLE